MILLFMRFCDLGWFRDGNHRLRAGDGHYKLWSVPGVTDLFLYYNISLSSLAGLLSGTYHLAVFSAVLSA